MSDATLSGGLARSATRARPGPARVDTEARPVRIALILASVTALSLLLLAPLAVVITEALAEGPVAALQALGDPAARSAVGLTLLVAAVSLPVNLVIGIAAAWAIAKFEFRGKALLITLIDLPFSVSPVVVGLTLVLLYGSQGWLGPWLAAHGVKIVFALPGIVLATLFITFPFVARELIPLMSEQGRTEEEAALTLGARPWRMFATVTLPNIRWALFYAALIANARAMGEFGAVAVVSGKIRGQTATMPIMIEMLYNEYLSTAAFAMAALLAALALVTLGLKSLLERRYAGQLAATRRH